MFVLKGLLRAETQEKILIYLLLRGTGYGKCIAEFYGIPASPVQKQLERLESDGVIASQNIGKVRNFELNPRYPFLKSLKGLLKSAVSAYPQETVNSLLVQRTRPRPLGKTVSSANSSGVKDGG